MEIEPSGCHICRKCLDALEILGVDIKQVQPDHHPRWRLVCALERDLLCVLHRCRAPVVVLDGVIAPVLEVQIISFDLKPVAPGLKESRIAPTVEVDFEGIEPDGTCVAIDAGSRLAANVDQSKSDNNTGYHGVFVLEGYGFRGFRPDLQS